MDGDCGGNDIAGFRVTREQCAAKCTSTPKCAGWGYIVSGTRKWPHPPCFLKNKMCEKPVHVKGLTITSYFKAEAGEFAFSTILKSLLTLMQLDMHVLASCGLMNSSIQ